jgi:hypothetical protein
MNEEKIDNLTFSQSMSRPKILNFMKNLNKIFNTKINIEAFSISSSRIVKQGEGRRVIFYSQIVIKIQLNHHRPFFFLQYIPK